MAANKYALNGGKNKDAADKDEDKKKTIEPKNSDKKDNWTPPPKVKDDKPPEIVAKTIDPKPDGPKPIEVVYAPASTNEVGVGQYVLPGIKAPAVLLQMKSEKAGWTRLADKDVTSGRPLLSLPGDKNAIRLNSGVEFTLWGNLFELTSNPILAESRAVLHANDLLDADVTLQRGRIVLRNEKKGQQNALVRVRFNNPSLPGEAHFDITLHGGAAVVLERFSIIGREPFYDDPMDKRREGPTAIVWVFAYGGSANIRSGDVSYLLDDSQLPMLEWVSRRGVLGPPDDPKRAPLAPAATPRVLKDKADQQAREKVIKSHAELVGLLQDKEIDVALAEIIERVQKDANRDLVAGKPISADAYIRWQYAIRCYAAIDNVEFLFSEFIANPTPLPIRGLYMQTLQQWIALGRPNDYLLLDVVQKNYRSKTASLNIMHLFHPTSERDSLKPETYEHLIEGLNNELMPIRMLSHWHLVNLEPMGWKIPYDPAAEPQMRQRAVRDWLMLIPPGKLPPSLTQPPMKKEKGKGKG